MWLQSWCVDVRDGGPFFVLDYLTREVLPYISADPSACGVLNSIRFDSKSEVKRSESEAKRKAKRSESEVKRSESESEAKSEASRSEAID